MTDGATQPSVGNRRVFWPAVFVGWGLIGLGTAGLLGNTKDTHPVGFARLFAGVILLHDALLAPVVFGVGLLVGRLVPRRVRAAVQGGLIATGLVVLFSWPLVRGYGSRGTNRSALPLDYGRGLLIVLATIWLTAGIVTVARGRVARSSVRPPDRGAPPPW